MPLSPTLLWFRQDLRLRDNPALAAAAKRGVPVVPVFIWDEEGEGSWPAGGASRWWLHHSLDALQRELQAQGSRLILRQGRSEEVLGRLISETGADAVYWNRRYEPAIVARDTRLKASLKSAGVEAWSGNSALLFEPTTIQNRQGGPFQVFGPFWRTCLAREVEEPVADAGRGLAVPSAWPASLALPDLGLLPRVRWDSRFSWVPGEAAARRALQSFLKRSEAYAELRDHPAQPASSQLSAHLHFGEIGPRQVWAAVRRMSAESGIFPPHPGAQKFLEELGWREFAHHLLFHFPETPERPLRKNFERFPWREDAGGRLLKAWQGGRTGYPIVDAAMRELWATGWMPNRCRMVTASFLVKHLRLPWREGAAWFWDTLVDADLAGNTLGWQWSAGCGADAAPYFRVFSPVLQGRKFDPSGDYTRRWVPELARVPGKWIHAPWEAPAGVLETAGVVLGTTYPRPVVEHSRARAEALEAYGAMGGSAG